MKRTTQSSPLDYSPFFSLTEEDFIAKVKENPSDYKNKVCDKSHFGLIHIAVLRGFSTALALLISLNFDVNLQANKRGRVAFTNERRDVSREQYLQGRFYFYTRNPNPSSYNLGYPTALHLAILTLDPLIVRQLIAANADTEIRSEQDSESFFASSLLIKLSYYAIVDPCILNELANCFSKFEHGGVTVTFTEEGIIEDIKFKRRPRALDLSDRYPEAYENNQLKSGYNVCHSKSYRVILAQYIEQYKNTDAKTSAYSLNEALKSRGVTHRLYQFDRPDSFTRLDFVDLCQRYFEHVHREGKEDLFVGSAYSNQAINWLDKLLRQKREYSTMTALSFKLFHIPIAPNFSTFFAVSARFRPFYDERDHKPLLKVATFDQLVQLKELAAEDMPEYFPSYFLKDQVHQYVAQAKSWLKNEIRQLLDTYSDETTIPFPIKITIAPEYVEYFNSLGKYNNIIENNVLIIENLISFQRLRNMTTLTFYSKLATPIVVKTKTDTAKQETHSAPRLSTFTQQPPDSCTSTSVSTDTPLRQMTSIAAVSVPPDSVALATAQASSLHFITDMNRTRAVKTRVKKSPKKPTALERAGNQPGQSKISTFYLPQAQGKKHQMTDKEESPPKRPAFGKGTGTE